MKRMIDFLTAVILLVLLSPVILSVALLIWYKLGNPVIFKQMRPGLHGRPFCIYKFRTMANLTDENNKLLPDGMRLTSFGKLLRRLSLDELPQLVNVIKGDLSFVGPRPLLMEYMPLYTPEQARRHEVKPGITGWAQVNGRNAISWEEKFALDIWYVDNHNLWLDFRIILLTFLKALKSEGINQQDRATMDKFRGMNL